MDYAVKKQIKHLCSYISDRTAVLQHVNREHNLRLTLRDIEVNNGRASCQLVVMQCVRGRV